LHHKDLIEDGFYDPFAADPSCLDDTTSTSSSLDTENEGGMNSEKKKNVIGVNCWHPPDSTVETQYIQVWEDDEDDEEIDGENQPSKNNDATSSSSAGLETLSWGYGGDDPDDSLLDDEEEIDNNNDGDDRSNVDKQRHVEEQRQQDGGKQQQQENLNGNHQECETSDDDECNNEAVIDSSDNEEATTTSSDADADVAAEKDKPASKKKKKGKKSKTILVDKHWGTDDNILKMRDRLRGSTNTKSNHRNTADGSNNNNKEEKNLRPPVFLLPGLASTRLVSWKHKPCPQSPLLSDIKMLDHVWLNMNLLIQMATIDVRCWSECMTLGRYQSDYDDEDNDVVGSSNATVDVAESDDGGDNDKQQQQDGDETTSTTTKMHGCKLRPDEGLDSISSLAPGSISSNLLVGGTNTVYAWLIQWLADNLGYDVTSIVALPYDWRLSPDKMESRDGFLTLMRKKIEAAVESNGLPGIMVAHSVSFVCNYDAICIVQCSSQKSNNVSISYLY
jgi:hypothetical protein